MGYKRSVFPEGGIDTLQELFDLPPSQLSNAERFQALKVKSNKTQTEITELNNLTINLQSYIIDVEKWNKFCDVCINLETFFRDNVEGYITTKQTEFNTTLQKFSNKGLYSSVITYQMWNTVVYNNQTYMSLQDNNINHTPTDGSNNAYWQIMALRGETGLGIGLVMMGLYNNATSYLINQAVSYNGSIYYCTQNSTGNIPTNTTFWGVFQANVAPVISPTQPSNSAIGQVWIQTY